MKISPLVTVGIPNYNYSRYIIGTLKSVDEQNYENIEIIIVDDCSTDNSVNIIEEWINAYEGNRKINFIKNKENLGLTKVCNLVLNNAAGKYFQPLDADDIILPQKISRQVNLLEANINAAFIYSNASVIDEKGNILEEDYLTRIHYNKESMPAGKIHKDLIKFNFVCLPTVLINTSKAHKVGGFDESLQVQDYYMWLKLTEESDVLYQNLVTAKYRVHAKSMGASSLTNTVSEDSVLNIKYRYYYTSKQAEKKIIKRNIQNSSIYLYEHKYPTAKKWIRLAFILKPGIKTFFYFFISLLGIPFSVIRRIKNSVSFFQ